MNAAGKIVLYFIAVLVCGCLLAPPLFWLGQSVAALHDEPFQRFFNRAALVSALALLWPLARSFRVKSRVELGLEPNPFWWRDILFGFTAALLLMLAMCAILKSLDAFRWHDASARKAHDLPKVFLSAFTVAVVEEALFRGAFLGLFRRTMGKWSALFVMSVIFSVLHFIKPSEVTIPASEVGWLSGFALLPATFSQFADPAMIGALFTTLFAVGWVLGTVTLRTRSLWMAIGLHAGWVVCVQGFGKFAKLSKDNLPWIGSELRIGIAPLALIILTGIICWLWLRRSRS